MGKREIVPHPTDPTLALVPLTQGHFAVISAVDSVAVGAFNWFAVKCAGGIFYARRWVKSASGRYTQYLHRFVAHEAGVSLDDEIDHANRNGLDCRRSNLRAATHAENTRNIGIPKSNTSGVRGVHWSRTANKWLAAFKFNGKLVYLGCFTDKADAATVVDRERKRLYGEFHAAQ